MKKQNNTKSFISGREKKKPSFQWKEKEEKEFTVVFFPY